MSKHQASRASLHLAARADDGVFYDRFASGHATTPAGVKKPAG